MHQVKQKAVSNGESFVPSNELNTLSSRHIQNGMGAAVFLMLLIFSNGKSINGIKATTGIGRASVIHHVIIKPAIASTFAAEGET